jgi:uncharacterized protein (TIGR03000 family)
MFSNSFFTKALAGGALLLLSSSYGWAQANRSNSPSPTPAQPTGNQGGGSYFQPGSQFGGGYYTPGSQGGYYKPGSQLGGGYFSGTQNSNGMQNNSNGMQNNPNGMQNSNRGENHPYGYGNPYMNNPYGFNPYAYGFYPPFLGMYGAIGGGNSGGSNMQAMQTSGNQSGSGTPSMAIPGQISGPAVLTVRVPEGAEFTVDGKSDSQTGMERRLISPVLQPGQSYTFHIKAAWYDDGDRKLEKSITVGPGENKSFMILPGQTKVEAPHGTER